VVDRLLWVFRLESRDEQCQALVGGRHEVAEPGDAQAVDFFRRFAQLLGPGFVVVQELHPLADKTPLRV
jgi:hypothetical protein